MRPDDGLAKRNGNNCLDYGINRARVFCVLAMPVLQIALCHPQSVASARGSMEVPLTAPSLPICGAIGGESISRSINRFVATD